MKVKNLSGVRFMRLMALEPLTKRDSKGRSAIYWRCKCDCGKMIVIAGSALRSGLTRSCGCFLKETRKSANTKHGGVGNRIYNIWLNMRVRCNDPSSPAYANYGARGIKVCDQWQNSFDQFRSDVGNPPSSKHSIDRFPRNDGNYEPGNVRWATAAQQGRNTRVAVFLDLDGERINLADAADRFGIRYDTLHNRIKTGWTVKQALNLEPRLRPRGWKVPNRRKFNGDIVRASRER